MNKRRLGIWLVALLVIQSVPAAAQWSVTVYGGIFADNDFVDIAFLSEKPNLDTDYLGFIDYDGSYMATLAVSKEFARLGRFMGFELEGQAAKHWGYQDNWEFNGLVVARWLLFPWDKYLDTSLAVGEGVSFATESPKVEGNQVTGRESAQWQNYMMAELAFSLPQLPHWSFIYRIHHRSTIFGNFPGTKDATGSNFLTWGLRYTF